MDQLSDFSAWLLAFIESVNHKTRLFGNRLGRGLNLDSWGKLWPLGSQGVLNSSESSLSAISRFLL